MTDSTKSSLADTLFAEIILSCAKCHEIYEPDLAASDPMEEWAHRNASLAYAQGWSAIEGTGTICPACSQKLPLEGIEAFDVVRLTSLKSESELAQVGDIATVLEIYPGNPRGVHLECCDSEGRTKWLQVFREDQIELEKV